MDNNLLISNILMLKRKLKIKVSKEIQGLEFFEALQLEVRGLKAVATTNPNLVELGAITLSAFATLISMVALLTFTFDTSYYFSTTKDGGTSVEVGLATYLIKNSLDNTTSFMISGVYSAGAIGIFSAGYLLIRQSRLSKKMKKLEILDFYLEEYLNNRNKNETNSYPNMNDSKD